MLAESCSFRTCHSWPSGVWALDVLPAEKAADFPAPERKLRRPPGAPAESSIQGGRAGGGRGGFGGGRGGPQGAPGGGPQGGPTTGPAGTPQGRRGGGQGGRGGGPGGGGYGPIEDLFEAVKGGPAEMTNFSYAGPFTEFILTGQLAMFAGPEKKVEWDPTAMKCTNEPELNRFVRRAYRKGWEV